jgi:phosphohistidine phosphatase
MILYIVRHAWAGQSGDPQWPDDDQRPLTEKGEKRFRKMMKKLAKRGVDPAQVYTSPLVRCKQTADIVAARAASQPTVTELDELRPGADAAAIIGKTQPSADQDIAWVGHAPDVGQLVGDLVGDDDARFEFAKGAVAAISFEDRPQVGRGVLCWLVTAKTLGC